MGPMLATSMEKTSWPLLRQLLSGGGQPDVHYFLDALALRPEAILEAEANGAGLVEQEEQGDNCRHILEPAVAMAAPATPTWGKADAENEQVIKDDIQEVGKTHNIQGVLMFRLPEE